MMGADRQRAPALRWVGSRLGLGLGLGLGLVLGGCGGRGSGVSEVVHWTRAQATRPELSGAPQLSDTRAHQRRIILGAHTEQPAALLLVFEAASLDVDAARGRRVLAVPTDVRIDVLDDDRPRIDATCTGPHWPPRDRRHDTSASMVVDCRTSLHDDDGATVIAVLQLYGDGTVVATGDVQLEPQ